MLATLARARARRSSASGSESPSRRRDAQGREGPRCRGAERAGAQGPALPGKAGPGSPGEGLAARGCGREARNRCGSPAPTAQRVLLRLRATALGAVALPPPLVTPTRGAPAARERRGARQADEQRMHEQERADAEEDLAQPDSPAVGCSEDDDGHGRMDQVEKREADHGGGVAGSGVDPERVGAPLQSHPACHGDQRRRSRWRAAHFRRHSVPSAVLTDALARR